MRRLVHLLLAAIFVSGGLQQMREPTPRGDRARKLGLPVTDEVVQAHGLVMLCAGLMLQLGALRKLGSAVLAVQMVIVTFIGHRFWEHEVGPPREQQLTQFFKNTSLLGAVLYVATTPDR